MAASFDRELARQYGDLVGAEAFSSGHNVQLGPSVDIGRTPYNGRNFEGLGEDPLLAGEMSAGYVNGIQQHPVWANAKHYTLNNQNTYRNVINVDVDERAMQEIYNRPFTDMIEDGDLGSAMCAYPKVNGVYSCDSKELMTDILRDQMGFGSARCSTARTTSAPRATPYSGSVRTRRTGRSFWPSPEQLRGTWT